MKKYKLLKDLPTHEAGEMFYLDKNGHLRACATQLIAYAFTILKKFPNLLDDWFEEVEDGAPWRGPEGGSYYYVDGSIMIGDAVDQRRAWDDTRYEVGNYYETEAEAERVIAKTIAYTAIKRDTKGFKPDWKDRNQVKWSVAHSCESKCLYATSTRWTQELGQIYFATRDDADRSLETHRPEWELLFDLDLDKEESDAR